MQDILKIGLLGKGIARSQSKNLHELLGELYNLKLSYQLLDMADRTAPCHVGEELRRCRDQGFRGMNVTHPYKREAYAEVTPLGDFPQGLTSVNTVLFEPQGILGDNTDYSGFYHAFSNQFGAGFAPGKVLILGAGGVGVAIAFALLQLGATELVIHDTSKESADSLLRQLAESSAPARLLQKNIVQEMQEADGLVNATPIGMFQYPGNPFPPAGLGGQNWVFDAVYTPENTEFLDHCRRKSITSLSGFRLFLYQGLHAFSRFSGINPQCTAVENEFLKRFPLI